MITSELLSHRYSSLKFLTKTPQADRDEYQAACRLWEVYVHTRNEFVQPGDGDEDDDEDGDDMLDNPGLSTEDEVKHSILMPFVYVF